MDCSYKKKAVYINQIESIVHFIRKNFQVKLDNTKMILLKEDAVPMVFSAFPSYYCIYSYLLCISI